MNHLITRRQFLGFSGAVCASAFLPLNLSAKAISRDPRFLFVFLRGGLDGLAAVMPVNDPDYAKSRHGLALSSHENTSLLPLDDLFVLNPNLTFLHQLYKNKEALIFHAIASPYRERSHFDAQDVMESGLPGVAPVKSGWLNRALEIINGKNPTAFHPGIAVGANVPVVMMGKAPIITWIPTTFDKKDNIIPLFSVKTDKMRIMDKDKESNPI